MGVMCKIAARRQNEKINYLIEQYATLDRIRKERNDKEGIVHEQLDYDQSP